MCFWGNGDLFSRDQDGRQQGSKPAPVDARLAGLVTPCLPSVHGSVYLRVLVDVFR